MRLERVNRLRTRGIDGVGVPIANKEDPRAYGNRGSKLERG